jgi:hypothetical protein
MLDFKFFKALTSTALTPALNIYTSWGWIFAELMLEHVANIQVSIQ